MEKCILQSDTEAEEVTLSVLTCVSDLHLQFH